ncbi:MAG: glycoside hydrolase family 29 [Candidatus Marinimicrobia bacterium]|nr:glycoside hydrolase family 29 [Candidatus Neomarinimicrobiota bacterium]
MNITRRHFLKIAGAVLPMSAAPALSMFSNPEKTTIPVPTPAQMNWQDAEVGIIYHFDLPIAARRFAPNNSVKETLDPDLYQPAQLDTDQWIEAAQAAGARYAVFTATHFNGFMQWQSDLYPYGLKQTSWKNGKADVVGAFVESCRSAGIQPGIYFSTHRNAYWTVWGHYVDWGEGKGTSKQAEFNRVAEQMTAELCSRYGDLIQIWYDAGVKTPEQGGPNVLPVFEKYQPDSVFYHNRKRADHRWIGNEAGYAGYPCWATMPGGTVSHNAPDWRPILENGEPDGSYWSPGMVDVPLRGANGVHNWFWNPGQDDAVHPVDDLVEMYYQSVGRNCNFVIGEVITPQGLVPESDIRHLAEFGSRIRERFGSPVSRTSGEGGQITLELEKPATVDQISISEDIRYGERIRSYTVSGTTSEGDMIKLCEGQSVGHKRIQRFDSVRLRSLELLIHDSLTNPLVKEFAVFLSEQG